VQSAEKSCEYQINALNEFLVAVREKVQTISDDDFKVQKQAVYTIINEQDINLSKQHERYWQEISLHRYDFEK